MRMHATRSVTAPRSQAVRQVDLQIRAGILRGLMLGALQAVLVCVLIGAIYLALPWLRLTFDKPISRVIIKGELAALNEDVIKSAVTIYENDTFLTIDLSLLVERLESSPWIAHARARRQWPDTVEITLVEQKPIAYWGDTAMVNAKGRIFEHQGLALDRSLPRLWSELGSPAEIMSYYQIFEQQLESIKLKLHSISQSVQGDWRLQLDNGMLVVLDRMDPVGNVRNFVGVYTQLLASSERRALVVDMRYRHGAAIRWEEQINPVENQMPATGNPAIGNPPAGNPSAGNPSADNSSADNNISGRTVPAQAGNVISQETGLVEARQAWL